MEHEIEAGFNRACRDWMLPPRWLEHVFLRDSYCSQRRVMRRV